MFKILHPKSVLLGMILLAIWLAACAAAPAPTSQNEQVPVNSPKENIICLPNLWVNGYYRVSEIPIQQKLTVTTHILVSWKELNHDNEQASDLIPIDMYTRGQVTYRSCPKNY